ncbi:MAG TPA: circadian clock protein KaiC, partial [Thermoanaerobaculia bacterium]|nr:circadian clock protein KaiC [Thermoanaerobaculia bacterium]
MDGDRERPSPKAQASGYLPKAATGITGLDEITGGGLPAGRPTLICGSAGCGKTLLATEVLVHGATELGEPGLFVAFEETAEDLVENVRSLGFDLKALEEQGSLLVEHIHIERSEIEEAGEYDLEGLFIRLGMAVDAIGAKRIVLDTLETLFGGLTNHSILRAELRRLFRWLKERNLTAVITAERGDGTLTRHGLEEYVSDCVILLDHRMVEQVATRRLRIVKYRGTRHGTNEYPFLIGDEGIEVLPITSNGLDYAVSRERVSSGVGALDEMLGGEGFYRGSTVLISGTAGTGKSSLSAHFAHASCASGETCLYFAFEESQDQILRNMRSVGIDLQPWIDRKLLHFSCARPTHYGLEMHLATILQAVRKLSPQAVIVDPISNLLSVGSTSEVKGLLTRLIDFLKERQITTFFTNLTSGGGPLELTEVGISSLVDSWLLLRELEANGERNRGLYVLKSRGMAHSNQVREFLLTSRGIELADVYIGPEGVLTGSARLAEDARRKAA